MHPETPFANFATIGNILSHSFLACGFLPIHIAFPTPCAILLGPFTSINEELMLSSFFDSLAIHEIGVINKALCIKKECYPKTLQRSLINILPTRSQDDTKAFSAKEVVGKHSIIWVLAQALWGHFYYAQRNTKCSCSLLVPKECHWSLKLRFILH